MSINKFAKKLNEIFLDDIKKSQVCHNNELYIEISTGKACEICRYLGGALNYPLVCMFANDERSINECFTISYVFADRNDGFFVIIRSLISSQNLVFRSIAPEIYAASRYELEIFEMYGLKPLKHINLKKMVFHDNWPDKQYPLRKDFDGKQKLPFENIPKTDFLKVNGEGVYEVPVGPVHAGIIEPGHFRFSTAGEPIINLEAQLYFVHKGIEKTCENLSIEKCYYISERISGDESFSNSLAYCQAIEKIAGVVVPERANYTRVIFAELERLTSHIGDLAGVCLDVGYGYAAYEFRLLRGWAYQLAEQLCKMRFLRSVNIPGGIRKDFIKNKEKVIIDYMNNIEKGLLELAQTIKANSLFIDRVENTGILSKEIAQDLNAVGPAARAAGLSYDVRKDFSYSAYDKLLFKVPEHHNGDVNCRVNVKIEECVESISLIRQAVEAMPEGKVCEMVEEVEPYKFALGYTESPRGENIHWVMTGEDNTIFRYKIRTPSFCNWPALCYSVKSNIIPDFPLINKSFNLSYSGNDL